MHHPLRIGALLVLIPLFSISCAALRQNSTPSRTPVTMADFDSMLQAALQATPARRQRMVWSFLERVKWRGGAPLADSTAVLFLADYGPPLSVIGHVTKMAALPMNRVPDTGLQYLKLDLPGDMSFEYAFSTDEARVFNDPLNQHPLSWRKLSLFTMPGWTPSPYSERIPEAPQGKIDTLLVSSPSLGYDRWVYLYLPPGYDPAPTDPYPFLLAGDGRSMIVGGRFNIIMDNLLYLGEVQPLIGIMVTTDQARRSLEYQTQPEWREFIINELLPLLRQRYPLTTDPAQALVMGVSFGGRMAIDMALRYPETFGMIGAFSPALHDGGEMLPANYSRFYRMPVRVFACMGNERYNTPLYDQWLAVLRRREVEVHAFEGNEGHSWSYWSKELPHMLQLCFPKGPRPGLN